MKCADFEKTISSLAGERLIEAGTRAAGLQHAKTCVRCAARLSEERALNFGLRAVRAELANEKAPAHLESVLLNAFRERAGRAVIFPIPQKQRSQTNWKVAAVAAAVLLAACAGAIIFVNSNSRPQVSATSIAPVLIPESPRPAPETIQLSDGTAPVQIQRHRTRRRVNRTETVTEYFPLVEGEDLDSLEFSQVIRVQLSATAVREVGLPLSYASPGGQVKADVVLGHDGMARAIRFVQ